MLNLKNWGEDSKILKAVIEVNEEQPLKIIELLKKHIPNLENKKVGILGLAFKPNTDDTRESRAISIAEILLEECTKVIAYDPKPRIALQRYFHRLNTLTLLKMQ